MAILYLIVFSMIFGVIDVLDECDKSHNCLTCSGVPYNCASCPEGYYLARGGAYYTCRSCPTECSECDHYMSCTKCHLEGRYGRSCEKVCSRGCLSSACEQLSGTCLCSENYEGGHCDYCAKGKYDIHTDCVKSCPKKCKTCISQDKCTKCKDGFFGEMCELNCSRGCYLGQCNKDSGKCHQEKCKPNFVGTNCTKCSTGLYGEYCLLSCPDNCVTCSLNTSCSECKQGFWGNICQHNCSHGCPNGSCITETGACKTRECRTGFVGVKCDRCHSGKQGLDCIMNTTLPGNDSSAVRLTVHTFSYLAVIMAVAFAFVQVFIDDTF